jgi:hypothetical protein
MLRSGAVDALWGAGAGWPGFVEVLREMPARLIAPDAEERARILAVCPFLRAATLAAHSYEAQPLPLDSVGSWCYVIARPTLDDATAYRVASAMHRARSLLAARLPAARETTLENTILNAPARELIHAGVARLAREAAISA